MPVSACSSAAPSKRHHTPQAACYSSTAVTRPAVRHAEPGHPQPPQSRRAGRRAGRHAGHACRPHGTTLLAPWMPRVPRPWPSPLPQAVPPVPRKPSRTTLPPLPAVHRLLSWAHPGTSHIERCPRPIPNHSARCWMRMHTHGVERAVTSRPPTTAPTALGSPQPSCASVPVVDGHPFSILHAYGHMASACIWPHGLCCSAGSRTPAHVCPGTCITCGAGTLSRHVHCVAQAPPPHTVTPCPQRHAAARRMESMHPASAASPARHSAGYYAMLRRLPRMHARGVACGAHGETPPASLGGYTSSRYGITSTTSPLIRSSPLSDPESDPESDPDSDPESPPRSNPRMVPSSSSTYRST